MLKEAREKDAERLMRAEERAEELSGEFTRAIAALREQRELDQLAYTQTEEDHFRGLTDYIHTVEDRLEALGQPGKWHVESDDHSSTHQVATTALSTTSTRLPRTDSRQPRDQERQRPLTATSR